MKRIILLCLLILCLCMSVNATDYSPYEIIVGSGGAATQSVMTLNTWFPQNITEGTLVITGRNLSIEGSSGIWDYGIGSRSCNMQAYNLNSPKNYSFDVALSYTTDARDSYDSNFTLTYVISNLQTFNLTRAMGYGQFTLSSLSGDCDGAFSARNRPIIIPPNTYLTYPEDYGRLWSGAQGYHMLGYYQGIPKYSSLTINVQSNTTHQPLNNTHVYYADGEGYTDVNGNVTFSSVLTGTSNIRAYKWGYDDYTESYALTGISFKQIYLDEGFTTPSCGYNSYNIITGDSGSDITDQVDVYEFYNGSWYVDGPPYLPLSFSHNFTYTLSNPLMDGKPSLSNLHCDGADANGTITFQKSGYMDYEIEGLEFASSNYIVMVPNSAIPIAGKCSKVFTTGELDFVSILITRSEVGLSETITAVNHLAQSINNNVGNYSFSAYNTNTGKLYNNGSFLCETGTNATGKTIDGVHREFIYDADLYVPIVPPPLPSRNVYVELYDSLTGGAILPYDIAIQDDLGVWYNYSVWQNLGKLTPHAYISDDRIITIYANANGYPESTKVVVLSGYGLDYNFDHVIKMTASKWSGNFAYTWWQIHVYDSTTFDSLPNTNVGIWSGLTQVFSGTTNSVGHFSVNISNNSGLNYDIVATKSGYKTGQINNVIPFGETYVNQIALVPNVLPTLTPTGTPLPTPTLFNGGLSSGVCRQDLDWDNETFWSPIINIEACIGIINPVYQQYILAIMIDILAGAVLFSRNRTKEGAVIGVTIGNTICAATGLISWSLWLIIMIPTAILFMYKGGAK